MPLSAKVSQIPQHQVSDIWPHVESFIEAACKRSNSSINAVDLFYRCLGGIAQLWVISKDKLYGACVTKLAHGENGLECTIIAHGADGLHRDEWMPLIKDIERWASLEGCKAIEIHGRRGWVRLLDYQPINRLNGNRVLLRKDLPNGR